MNNCTSIFRSAFLLAFGVFTCLPVSAAVVPGLFNTGVDASGNALVGGDGVTDSHWVVVGGSNALTYKHPAYLAENANSRWINPNGSSNDPGGSYTLRLTFDLTGFNPSTAAISGLWGVDNCGNVSLNGVAVSGLIAGCQDMASFQSLIGFSFTSGFVAGLNTLDLVVSNSGGPSAARVDNLTGSADAAEGAVPEPASIGFAAMGLSGLFLLRRRA
jgi:hypothetical protein